VKRAASQSRENLQGDGNGGDRRKKGGGPVTRRMERGKKSIETKALTQTREEEKKAGTRIVGVRTKLRRVHSPWGEKNPGTKSRWAKRHQEKPIKTTSSERRDRRSRETKRSIIPLQDQETKGNLYKKKRRGEGGVGYKALQTMEAPLDRPQHSLEIQELCTSGNVWRESGWTRLQIIKVGEKDK